MAATSDTGAVNAAGACSTSSRAAARSPDNPRVRLRRCTAPGASPARIGHAGVRARRRCRSLRLHRNGPARSRTL